MLSNTHIFIESRQYVQYVFAESRQYVQYVFALLTVTAIPILMCVIPVGVVAMSSSTFSEDFGYPH